MEGWVRPNKCKCSPRKRISNQTATKTRKLMRRVMTSLLSIYGAPIGHNFHVSRECLASQFLVCADRIGRLDQCAVQRNANRTVHYVQQTAASISGRHNQRRSLPRIRSTLPEGCTLARRQSMTDSPPRGQVEADFCDSWLGLGSRVLLLLRRKAIAVPRLT